MGTIIAIILLIVMILAFIVWIADLSDVFLIILVVVMLLLGMCLILFDTETDDYTKWVDTNENGFILQIDGEYVLDNGSEYLFKILEYTDTGEKKEEILHIEKAENIFVEYVEIDDETAFFTKYERENKNIFGFGNKAFQTKYIVYIPTE